MAEDRQQQEHRPNDLETRLAAFYGPELLEQPLPPNAWERLRQQLGSQDEPKPARRIKWHSIRELQHNGTRRKAIPLFVQDSFERIRHQAHWNQKLPPLHYTTSAKVREPSLRMLSILLVGTPTMRVTLPIDAPITMRNIEVDVLLAAGLARAQLMKQFRNKVLYFVLAAMLLLMCFVLLYSLFRTHLYPGIPIAIVLLTCIVTIWEYSQRQIAFAADRVVANWLGRGRVCEGLHELARHSRRPQRSGWSEPSLEERIKRICGTRVTSRDRDLTLVG